MAKPEEACGSGGKANSMNSGDNNKSKKNSSSGELNPKNMFLAKEYHNNVTRPMLKKCAVPSRFPWNEHNSSLHQKKKERHQRRLARNERKISVQVHINNEKEKDDTFLMETTNFCEVEIEFEKKQKDIGIQCDLCGSDNLKTLKECPPNENKKKSSIANVLDITNAAEVQFYTGFQDYEHIKFIFSIFGDEEEACGSGGKANSMNSGDNNKSKKNSSSGELNPKNMFLAKEYHNNLHLKFATDGVSVHLSMSSAPRSGRAAIDRMVFIELMF
ncbi:hypothetical protein evm_013935 [Chilo suppressalis]|nr:hypothetical protein evm_013935 [Chilo suppressalis]